MSRNDKKYRIGETYIGLHEEVETAALLLVAPCFGQAQSEHVAPAHATPRSSRRWQELVPVFLDAVERCTLDGECLLVREPGGCCHDGRADGLRSGHARRFEVAKRFARLFVYLDEDGAPQAPVSRVAIQASGIQPDAFVEPRSRKSASSHTRGNV